MTRISEARARIERPDRQPARPLGYAAAAAHPIISRTVRQPMMRTNTDA
jgi:hypothetical protein